MTASPLAVLLPGFAGPTLPGWVAGRLDDGLAGVCLFGENIESPEQLRLLTAEIRSHRPSAVIATDEEGGDVTRLYARSGAPDPGNGWLGHHDDEAVTAVVAAGIAAELAAGGVTLNLAPTADVNADPDNPVIGTRSFGGDPDLVARHTAAWVRAHEAAGVATCLKHFPGHGDTDQDSHLALPVVDASVETLEQRDLPPFAAGIAAGATTVMTSHLRVPALDDDRPATFSPSILGGLLRERLGFAGVVVSDALDMAGASADTGIPAAAVRALAAGCDLLCLGTRITEGLLDDVVAAIETAVADGRLPRARLEDAAARVARLVPRDVDATPAGRRRVDAVAAAAGFVVTPAARHLLSLHAGGWRVVQLEDRPNIAVGSVPWGPGAVADVAHVDELTDPATLPRGPLVLVGRDLHRHGWMAALVGRLRAERDDCLVVEMGTPHPGALLPDVTTYGGSALLGAALLRLLAGEGS